MMRRTLLYALLALVAAIASIHAAPTDEQALARKTALDLAGAFSNDGFKLRDGHWVGPIAVGKPQLIQVNLYAGNEYWFSAGATPPAKRLAVSVYDEKGQPVDFEPYAEGASAAAGFSPTV